MIRRNTHALNFLSSCPHERVIQFGMSGIQCPRCGREADGGGRFWRDGKPYCPACGWNVDRANALRGTSQKLLAIYLFGIAIFLAVIGSTAASSKKHLWNFAAFGVMLLVLAFISWHRKKSRKSEQSSVAIATPSSSLNAFRTPINPAIPAYERLRMLSRPRVIRLKAPLRIFTLIAITLLGGVGSAVSILVQKQGTKTEFYALPNLMPFAMFVLIWSLIAIAMLRSVVRDRGLVSDGEIAVATVTSQWFAGGESRDSRITYEFKDAAGRTFSGKATDRTRKIFEEMQTPVFYDPMNPAKNVPLVGATYDVVES